MAPGFHHFHKRKRIHLKHEPYPHPDPRKRFIDKAIYVVCIAGPIFTIPQVWKIWVGKNASGVAVISWISYLVMACFWLVYGIEHKEAPIIITNCIWIVLEIMVIAGTFMYG